MEPGVSIDDGGDGRVARLLGDVALVDEGELPPIQRLHGPGRLGGTQFAAVAEHGGEVAFARAVNLGVEPGDRAEVAGAGLPVLRGGGGGGEAERGARPPPTGVPARP